MPLSPTRNADPDSEINALAAELVEAATTVHQYFGPGFQETVYLDAMCIELGYRGVPFMRQVPVNLVYRGMPVGEGLVDLYAGRRIICSLKAVDDLTDIHEAQMMSFLRMTGCKLGMIFNFNVPDIREGMVRVAPPAALANAA